MQVEPSAAARLPWKGAPDQKGLVREVLSEHSTDQDISDGDLPAVTVIGDRGGYGGGSGGSGGADGGE